MLKGNRSIIAALGSAFLFFSLAAIPACLSPWGVDLCLNPRVKALTDAWVEIAGGFVSGYRPINITEWSAFTDIKLPEATTGSQDEQSYIARVNESVSSAVETTELTAVGVATDSVRTETANARIKCPKARGNSSIGPKRNVSASTRQVSAPVERLNAKVSAEAMHSTGVIQMALAERVEALRRVSEEYKKHRVEMGKAMNDVDVLKTVKFMVDKKLPTGFGTDIQVNMPPGGDEMRVRPIRVRIPEPPCLQVETSEI